MPPNKELYARNGLTVRVGDRTTHWIIRERIESKQEERKESKRRTGCRHRIVLLFPSPLLPDSSSSPSPTSLLHHHHHHHPEHESLSLHATLHFVQWMHSVSLRVSMKRRAESETRRQRTRKNEDGIFFLLLSFTCILHFFASTLAVFMLLPSKILTSFTSLSFHVEKEEKRGERKRERIRRRRKKRTGTGYMGANMFMAATPFSWDDDAMEKEEKREKSLNNKKEPASKLSMNRREAPRLLAGKQLPPIDLFWDDFCSKNHNIKQRDKLTSPQEFLPQISVCTTCCKCEAHIRYCQRLYVRVLSPETLTRRRREENCDFHTQTPSSVMH